MQELLRLAWLGMRTERLLASGHEPEMKRRDAMSLADALILIPVQVAGLQGAALDVSRKCLVWSCSLRAG